MNKNEKPAPTEPYVGVLDPEVIKSVDGLTYLQGMASGKYPLPPVMHNGKYRVVEAEKGRVVVEGEPSYAFLNPMGVIHGGWIATVLDTALACAAQTVIEAGEGTTTVEFKINCVRPLTEATGTVTAIGEVIQRGRRLSTTKATMTDRDGKVLAHGTETCMIFPVE
ncbi:MAG: PaaI family thioesterase [Fimbriimonadaceae bacterium]|nr:PaaI family thioesterase [Alphaproteobacteria bacterium]